MECPVCQGSLDTRHLLPSDLPAARRCEKCSGLWIDGSDFARAAAPLWREAETMSFNSEEVLAAGRCPTCSVQLTSVSPEDDPTLVVERCPECHGMWFDKGELARLAHALNEYVVGHDTPPPGWSPIRWFVARIGAGWRQPKAG